MSKQTKNNKLNSHIDPTFIKANRLSVLLFQNEDDRIYFSKHYTPNVKIKEFTVWIDEKKAFVTLL